MRGGRRGWVRELGNVMVCMHVPDKRKTDQLRRQTIKIEKKNLKEQNKKSTQNINIPNMSIKPSQTMAVTISTLHKAATNPHQLSRADLSVPC